MGQVVARHEESNVTTINKVFNLCESWVMPVSTLCVVLLITYLVTSADSAVLVINTIVSGGATEGIRARHIMALCRMQVACLGVAGDVCMHIHGYSHTVSVRR